MSRTPLESCRLAERKYAFFSRTGSKTKKLQPSNLFPLTIFKYRLLERLAFLFRYSYTSCTPLKMKVWSTVFPRLWVTHSPKFAYPPKPATRYLMVPRSKRYVWTAPKRSELPLFFAALGRAVRCWKALDLRSLNMQLQQDGLKDKKITAL